MVNQAESTDTPEALSAAERQELRDQFYNATIIKRMDAHEHLARFRVRPDGGTPRFQAGQYVALGLGYWEPRIAPSQPEELAAKKLRKVVRRAYSICCPMLGDDGRLASCDDIDYLEFYITLVRFADSVEDPAPALTPRLFKLGEGDRLSIAPKIVGTYTLAGVEPDDHVLMLGTGTGEAPHNAMAAALLRRGHRGQIVVATTARYLRDLAYCDVHARLMTQHPNFVYLPLTTREPHNTDPSHPQYVGKEYPQEMLTSGRLEEQAGTEITPQTSHVFLCGNPDMIGYVPPGAPPLKEPGMLQLFEQRGFEHKEHQPGVGTIRFEKYW
ncbi:MAG: ferredoxin--NADP reductase [Pirellulaceae bacterium]